LNRFNLMITFEGGPYNYRYVLSLLRDLIGEYQLIDSSGSVMLLHVEDPYGVVSRLRVEKDRLNLIYRVIPVDHVLNPYVEEVAEKASQLAGEKIPQDKTYRVTLHGRLYWRETRLPAHSIDAVRIIAEKIDRKVNLTNPDYVVYVRSIKFYHRRRLAALTVTETRNILVLKSDKP